MRALVLVAATIMVAACMPKSDTETASGAKPASTGAPAKGTAPEDDAPTLDIAGGCKADGLQRYVGKAFTPAIAEQMKKEAGAQMLRTAHENGMITMDYNSGRLNVFYNDANAIVRVDCG